MSKGMFDEKAESILGEWGALVIGDEDLLSQALTEAYSLGKRESDEKWAAGLLERTAQLIAHRVCFGSEHDPSQGKLHGYCVACGTEWPCEYAGKPPDVK